MHINKFVFLPLISACALVSCGPKVSVTSENTEHGTVNYFINGNKISMEAFPKDNYLFTGWFLKDNTDNEYRFQSPQNPWVVEFKGNTTYQARFETISTQTFAFNLKKDKFTEMPTHFSVSNFYGTGLKNVVVPNTHYGYPVKEIEDYTFKDFSNIESIVIPNNIVSIGDGAFEGCTKISSITIDHDIENFGAAFTNWTSSQTIYIPKSCVTELKEKYESFTHKTTWNWFLIKQEDSSDTYLSKEAYCGSDQVKIVAI